MENDQFGSAQQPNQPIYQSDGDNPGVSLPPPYFTQAEQKGMFVGRLNRMGFLLSIVYIVAYFLAPIIVQLLVRFNPEQGQAISQIFNLITLLWGTIGVALVIPVTISVGVRRWHDLNQSGALMLLNFIPFVGLITFFIQLLPPGDKADNKYGAPDTKPPKLLKVLFGR